MQLRLLPYSHIKGQKEHDRMAESKFVPAKVVGKMDLKKDRGGPSEKEILGQTSENSSTTEEMEGKISPTADDINEPKGSDAEASIVGSPESASTDSSTSENQSIPHMSSAGHSPAADQAPQETSEPISPVSPLESDRLQMAITFNKGYLDKYINPSALQGVGIIGPPEILLDEHSLERLMKELWCHKVESGMDESGRLVAAQKFDNNPERIFSPGRSSGVIYAQMSKILDGKIDARRLAEATRAAGVYLELKQAFPEFKLSYSQRVQIGRLNNRLHRILLARGADAEKLTVEQLKKRVATFSGEVIPEDTRISKAIVRQLNAARNLLTDPETRFFVGNRDRLKKALDQDIRSDMLKHTVAARKNVGAINQLLVDLENALVDIEVSERKKKASEADENTNAGDPGRGQDDR
jgi:hypothetical protein